MLHSLTGSDEQSSLTLSLQNGSLAFATEVGGAEGVELVSTATGVIQEDTWYQLFATRCVCVCKIVVCDNLSIVSLSLSLSLSLALQRKRS